MCQINSNESHINMSWEKKTQFKMILLLWLKAINIYEKRNGTLTT